MTIINKILNVCIGDTFIPLSNTKMHHNLLLFIAILILASCNEITKEDLKGNWIAVPSGKVPDIWGFNFKGDSVELIGDYLFKESGKFQVENGKLKFHLNRDNFKMETEILRLEADTLLIFDSLVFHRNREINNFDFQEYELIGHETNRFLSQEKKFFRSIDFYKIGEEIHFRFGDKQGAIEDVHLFLEGGHSKPKVLVFIGKGINLKNLQSLYYRLASEGQQNILLATKREGIFETHVLNDEIEIWWEDLEHHLANLKSAQPPPPPSPIVFNSKASYLKKGGTEIKISEKEDFQKIEELTAIGRFVVSISPNLPIEDYFELKKRLREWKQVNKEIMTEIE
ncbi:MAG: hypothetical protein WAT92_19520 [Saprospiraceae bacterium]